MTDNKPIARYWIKSARQGIEGWFVPESVLAEKDARIELLTKERDHIQQKLEGCQSEAKDAFANWRDFSKAYSELRTAIREKAEEWKATGWDELVDAAAELFAMLEEGK